MGILLSWFQPIQHLSYIHYLFHGFFPTNMVEWGLANQQFVSKHSNTPQINSVVIFGAFQNLWSRIVECSAVCLPPFVAYGCPSEIAQLSYLVRKDYILWLYVSMSDPLVMQIFNSLSDVFDFSGRLLFRQGLTFLHLSKKSAFFHVLQYQIDEFSIVKTSIYLQDVLMITETLDLNLEQKLVLHVVLLYHFFRDLFQSKKPTRLLMNCLENCSKLAFTKTFTQKKVAHTEAPSHSRFLLIVFLEDTWSSGRRDKLPATVTQTDCFFTIRRDTEIL